MSMRISEALILLVALAGCDQRNPDRDDPRTYPVPLAAASEADRQSREIAVAAIEESGVSATEVGTPGTH